MKTTVGLICFLFSCLFFYSTVFAQEGVFQTSYTKATQVTKKSAIITNRSVPYWYEGETVGFREGGYLGSLILKVVGTHDYELASGRIVKLKKVRMATKKEIDDFKKSMKPPTKEELKKIESQKMDLLRHAYKRYSSINKKKYSKIRLVDGSHGYKASTLIGFTGPSASRHAHVSPLFVIQFDLGLTSTKYDIRNHYAYSQDDLDNYAQFLTKDKKLVGVKISNLDKSMRAGVVRRFQAYKDVEADTRVTFAIVNGIFANAKHEKTGGTSSVSVRLDWSLNNPVTKLFATAELKNPQPAVN